jgi:hypothetical protein
MSPPPASGRYPDRPTPPAGEEIHVPESSIQPLLVAVFLTLFLVGLTFHWILCVIGGVGLVWTVARWIRDARRELGELPVHADH